MEVFLHFQRTMHLLLFQEDMWPGRISVLLSQLTKQLKNNLAIEQAS